MHVKAVQTRGWTNPALTARFWAAMEDEQRQRMAERLVGLRSQRDWSAERLAQEAGVSSKTISRLENGQVEEPRSDTMQKIAGALGVDTEAITGPRLALAEGEAGPIERLEEKLAAMEALLQENQQMMKDLLAFATERALGDVPPPDETPAGESGQDAGASGRKG